MPTARVGGYFPVPETIPAGRSPLRPLHPPRFPAGAPSLTIFQTRTTSARSDTVPHKTPRCLRDRAVRESSSVITDRRLTISESAAGVVEDAALPRWIGTMPPVARSLSE